jgi:hypothetical protein
MKYNESKIQECADWVKVHGLMEHGGATLVAFCKAMDISQETYFAWMKKTEFSESIKKAKEMFRQSLEERVVNSMVQAATGYEYNETSTEYVNRDGERVIKKQSVTSKRVQANVAAGIFLLTNIAPERWKNKQNTEHTGQIDTGITFVVENEEQVDKLKRLAERKPRNESND